MEPIDPEIAAHAINRLLKRFADIGWLESSAITPRGLHIKYSPAGRKQLGILRGILLGELDAALKFEEFQALIGVLLTLDSSDPTERKTLPS